MRRSKDRLGAQPGGDQFPTAGPGPDRLPDGESEAKDDSIMRQRSRILLAALTATLALAGLVGVASARRIEISEPHFLIHFREIRFELGGNNVVCDISLEGSFHSRTISKVCGQLVGLLTEAMIRHPCSGGEAFTLTRAEGRAETLPWRILYIRFRGVLPNISSIYFSLRGVALVLEFLGLRCLYKATEASPIFIEAQREAAGALTGVRVDETVSMPLFEGFGCPERKRIIGTGIIGGQFNEWRALTVRLVQ